MKFSMRYLGAILLFFVAISTMAFAISGRRPVSRAEVVPSRDELKLAFPGTEAPIRYKKYGKFTNLGTSKYRYVIKNKEGLANAAGEGVFPNRDAYKDPAYRKIRKSEAMKGNHWQFVETPFAARNFYKWATTTEDPGVKQFYAALMLERAGFIEQAIKGFYAVAVHFPKTVSMTYYKTPWYVGPTSLDRVEQLLRRHPEIKMKLSGAKIKMRGVFDVNTKNDKFEINPGKLVKVKKRKPEKVVNLKKMKVVQKRGGSNTEIRQYKNGHWQLFFQGEPFPVRAITYSIVPVGLSPDRGTWNPSKDWQLVDTNENGKHDGFFESFIDANFNNVQDPEEPTVGDAALLQDMGVNTLRAYHHVYDKKLFRKLYKDYGLTLLVGDLLGGYATGSGAAWSEGTDYENPEHRKNMLNSVRSMVEEHKDEPYVLMWVLGNENVYGVANNSNTKPEAFFKFVNEATKLIQELDPTRPVAYANGDLLHLDIFQKHCPDVDVFGANVYRGEQGMGRHLFATVKDMVGRPVLVTEYGASAFAEGYSKEEAEAFQAMYLANNWEDMEAHMAGRGEGVALGGVLFEFIDEWWKANSDLPEYVQKEKAEWYATKSEIYKNLQPDQQDVVPQFGLPFLDGWSYEEWLGVTYIGNGQNSVFVRQLRPAYNTMKKLWKPKG